MNLRSRLLASALVAAITFPFAANAQQNFVATTTGSIPLTMNLGSLPQFGCVYSGITSLNVGQYTPLPCDSSGRLSVDIGGSSGSVAVTEADGANVTQGATTDSAYAGSGASTVVAILKGIYNAVVSGSSSIVTAITNSAITYPTPAATYTTGASGSITSLVLKASATVGGVKAVTALNLTATSGFCVLYNATSAPGTGALTAANVLWFWVLPANGACGFAASGNQPPIAASTGAVLLVTSAVTPYTYTTGVITAAMGGLAQ